MRIRLLVIGCIAAATIVAQSGRNEPPPIAADGPDTSFSVDLDAGTPGIQTTRSVPLGQLFSISVWLDATDVNPFVAVTVRFHYDDVHLTMPESTFPNDWKDASVLNTTSGTSAPWPESWHCGPDPSTWGWSGEDGVGTATLITACYYEATVPTYFTGPVFEYVFQCDIEGPADIMIDDTDHTEVTDPALVSHWGHKHHATVNCGSGDGDADGDGLPDAYEDAHSCLNASVADADGDPDLDNFLSLSEFQVGTDPCVNDTDGDGCADGEEHPSVNTNIARGGDRDPLVTWDFFDVPAPADPTPGTDGKPFLNASSVRNKAVTLSDVSVILSYVGRTNSSPYYTADGNNDGIQDGVQLDRIPSTTFGKPWRSAAPNGAISLQDVSVGLSQVGHNCAPAP